MFGSLQVEMGCQENKSYLKSMKCLARKEIKGNIKSNSQVDKA